MGLRIALVMIVLMLSIPSMGNELEISSTIKHLSPYTSVKAAKEYAIIIKKYSERYKINWKIAVAIFRQESSFRLTAVNLDSKDFGIGQINWYNVKKRRIKLAKLLNDPDYAIHQTFRMLSELKKRHNTGSKGWRRWYTRYHSGTPFYRKNYYNNKLLRWFTAMEKYLNENKKTFQNPKRGHSNPGTAGMDVRDILKVEISEDCEGGDWSFSVSSETMSCGR